MKILAQIAPADIAAFLLFVLCWLFYEPLLRQASRGKGAINTNMTIVRQAWMANMVGRENRFLDSQLMGHALNSASFFASANLIVIAAAAGALFGGEATYRSVTALAILDRVPRMVFDLKLAVVTITLARGFLDFIWSIRQMNYCLAAIGAAPEYAPKSQLKTYAEAAAQLLNPALSSFNAGVRGYYFALAGAAWLLGPIPFAASTLGAIGLLVWRQRHSRAAQGVRQIRALIEARHASGEADAPPHRARESAPVEAR